MIDNLINFLHLLGTVIWIGGALFIHLILQPSLKLIDPPQAGKLYGVIAKRFSMIAWSAIFILIITGFLKTPSGMLFDPSTHSGLVLVIKHIFIIAVIGIGLLIALVMVPRMQTSAPKPGEKPSAEFQANQKRMKVLTTANTLLGVFILIFASMLW